MGSEIRRVESMGIGKGVRTIKILAGRPLV